MPKLPDSTNPVVPEVLDPLLESIVRENREKVVGWINDEPGCWGYLAAKGVTACRAKAGRTLSDVERRMVWNRLWAYLEQIKAQAGPQ